MEGIPSLLQIVKTMMALKIIEIVNHFNNILITFKMKKIVITLICLLFFCEATYAQIKTEKYFIGITNTFFMGVSSNMSPMESYLSQRDELHKNPSLGVLGFSYEGDAFLIDNLAYHLELSPYIGRELAEITNDEISTIGIKFSLGLEYYFNLNQKDKLSIGGGIGYDVFGYFYNNHSARYNNYVIPFSITFWHNRVGYSLLYEPCISKGVPTNNPSALPELAPNYICFSVRLK